MAHFFVSVIGSKIHWRLAQKFIDIYTIYIPIFYENTLLSLALMIYADNTLVGVELSPELVEPLNEYVNCEIYVIFDKDNTYVSNGVELSLIQSNISSVESTVSSPDAIVHIQ